MVGFMINESTILSSYDHMIGQAMNVAEHQISISLISSQSQRSPLTQFETCLELDILIHGRWTQSPHQQDLLVAMH